MDYNEYRRRFRFLIAIGGLITSSAALSQQFDRGAWINDQNGCKAWNQRPAAGETIVWTGQCVDGHIEGPGRLTWFKDGKHTGTNEGFYLRGHMSGPGVRWYANGSRLEGEFSDGLLTGKATVTRSDASRETKLFKNGALVEPQIYVWPYGDFLFTPPARTVGYPIPHGSTQGQCATLDYPAEVPVQLRKGTTLIQYVIDDQGRVSNTQILQASAHAALDQAALSHIASCTFNLKSDAAVTLRQAITWDWTSRTLEELAIEHRAPVTYPALLRKYGNIGRVAAEVTVSTSGTAKAIRMLESAHPAFEKEAVHALLRYRFRPATLRGNPTEYRIVIPLNFQLTKTSAIQENYLPFKFPAKASDKLPPEFQYDAPPAIWEVAPVVYPVELLKAGVRGSATVKVAIDPSGSIHAVDVIEASHPEFGLATKAMMSSWRFSPARKNGQPCWAVFSFEQRFRPDERNFNLDDKAFELLDKLKSKEPGIYTANELDSMPEMTYSPPPLYPIWLRKQEVSGRAHINVYVDSTGDVYFPHIEKMDNEELAWIAATTAARWQFSPPMRQGKPVAAMLTVPVVFNLEKK